MKEKNTAKTQQQQQTDANYLIQLAAHVQWHRLLSTCFGNPTVIYACIFRKSDKRSVHESITNVEKSTKISIRATKCKYTEKTHRKWKEEKTTKCSDCYTCVPCFAKRRGKKQHQPNNKRKRQSSHDKRTTDETHRLERTRDAIIIIKPYHISSLCHRSLPFCMRYKLVFVYFFSREPNQTHKTHFRMFVVCARACMCCAVWRLLSHYHKFRKTTENCLMAQYHTHLRTQTRTENSYNEL